MIRTTTTFFLLACLLCPVTGSLMAQNPTWENVPGVTGAPTWTRENPGAASATHMYVFGGRTNNSGGVNTNALWEFDGATWVQRTANGAMGSPPARDRAAVCWDFTRDKLVVFGGRDASNVPLDDTWEWDPNTNAWTQIPSIGPSPREFVAMAWDPTSTDLVLFGGLDSNGTHLNDTWSLIAGAAWVQMAPTNIPSVRRQHSMVTRSDFGDVLMCGGQDATLAAPAKWRTDVWVWDGFNLDWSQLLTVNTPASVVANQAVYDPFRQVVVMTGGNGINGGSPTSEISEFDCIANDWTVYAQATPSTPAPVIGRVSRYFAAFLPTTGHIYKVNGQVTSGASPQTTIRYGFGLPPTYPGSGADAAITVDVNGTPDGGDIHDVAAGDLVGMSFDSPGGSLTGTGILSFFQVFTTGAPPAQEPTLGLFFDPILPTFILVDGVGAPASFLNPVLGGFTFVGSIPAFAAGTNSSLLLNLMVIEPGSPLFGFGIADAHELRIL